MATSRVRFSASSSRCPRSSAGAAGVGGWGCSVSSLAGLVGLDWHVHSITTSISHTIHALKCDTERSMAELRPLVEVAFQLLDHLCSGQFKLGAQVRAMAWICHRTHTHGPPIVRPAYQSKTPHQTKSINHKHTPSPRTQTKRHAGHGREPRGAAGDRGERGTLPGGAAEGGGGAAPAGAGARGVSLFVLFWGVCWVGCFCAIY